MKGMERITTVRLAEALSQSGAVPTEIITDALYQQDQTGIPFCEVLVDAGEVSEWDLAKVVVQHFQLPFMMASSVTIDENAVKSVDEDFLFEHRLLPIDLCGDTLSVSMPVLVPHKILSQVESKSGKTVFPYVGLASENVKLLFQIFPEHTRDIERKVAAVDQAQEADLGGGGAWESIFDVGDQEVLKDLGI